MTSAKNILICLFCLLIIKKAESQITADVINQEFTNLETNSQLSQLEDTLKIKINSLAKCLAIGDYSSGERLKQIKKRTKQIAEKHFEKKKGLILTWGTNGNCGRYGEWYDDITIKYGFKYASVNCSCIVGNIPDIVEAYNSFSYPFLENRNGKGWKKNLEKEILAKKQNIELDIKDFEIEKLDEIHISVRELKKYPNEVEQLTQLKKLYFNINHLSSIGSGICKLEKLEVLGLHSNDFKVFPKEIFCLENLKKLHFDRNKLKRIPSNINELKNIEEINLANNKLKRLPNEFSKLENLSRLDLRENRLIMLPDNFHLLKNLKTLILWDNKLKNVPKSLYKMKHLETLFIDFGNSIPKSEIEELKRMLPNTEIK